MSSDTLHLVHPTFEYAMEQLLEAWRTHHDNQRSRASVPELARTRAALDDAREVMYQLRRRLAPDPAQLAQAPVTVTCAASDMPVVLRPEDLQWLPEGLAYRCVCGATTLLPGPLVERLGRLQEPGSRSYSSDSASGS